MRVLRRWAALSLCAGVLSVAFLVAPADGQQPPIELKPRFDLTIGNRVAKYGERGAALSGWIGFSQPGISLEERAQITQGSLWLPRGLSFHGDEFPRCSRQRMHLDQSVDRCPRRSIVDWPNYGRGHLRDVAAVEDGLSEPDYVFVNGGARQIWAFMTIYYPALVRAPVPIDVHELRGRKWSYRLDFELPKILIIVAGVAVSLSSFDLDLDGIEQAPGYITIDRRCPKRGHFAYRASLTFLHNDNTTSEASRRSRLRCRGRAA